MTMPTVPMTKGNKAQRERFLKAVLGVQTKSGHTQQMTDFIIACGKAMGAKVQRDGENVYLTKGKAAVYPTFIAHTDTVHKIITDFRVLESDGLLLGFDQYHGEQVGVGGDDKVGVFLALQMLLELEYGKAAFFYDEEVGCIGARRADLSFFSDSAFLIQGDRRGVSDVVVRASGDDLCSPEFQLAIAPQMTKYKRELCRTGLMTDVQELTSMHVGVSALNLSCGYFNPHSNAETVSIPVVMNTLKFIREVTKVHGATRWEHQIPIRKYGRYYGGSYMQSALPRDDAFDFSRFYDDDEDFEGVWEQAMEQAKRGRLTNRFSNESGKKVHPRNRWRLQLPKNAHERENRMTKVVASIAKQIASGRKWVAPSLEYPERTYLDWQVETSFCPDCGRSALTLDLADESTDGNRREMITFCWACGESKWKAGDTISFWWTHEIYTEEEAQRFIELEMNAATADPVEESGPDDNDPTQRALVIVA